MSILPRLRQILMVGGVETLGVVLAGIAGLLIVNVLPKEQYAAYTFLIACMQLVLGVTDAGLSHCCLPVVGQRTKEPHWVVGACHRVFRKRWWLLLAGFTLVIPYWLFNSRQHDWSWPGYWLASAVVVAVVLQTLRENYAHTVLLILGHISSLNRVAFFTHGMRLLLIGSVLLLPIGAYTLAGIFAATATAGLIAVTLYRRTFIALGLPEPRLDPDEGRQVDARVVEIAKPLILPTTFYQFQGVITVFIVSLFGTAEMLAEVGAFGRLSMVLIVFDRVANILLFPAIARAPEGRGLRSLVAKAHLAYLGLMTLVFLSAVLLPQYWMLLLGSQYKNREALTWMPFLATLLMSSAGFAFRTIAARGYTVRQTWIIPVVLGVQTAYLAVFGVADLKAVFGFGIATSLANFAYQYAMLFNWYRQQTRDSAAST